MFSTHLLCQSHYKNHIQKDCSKIWSLSSSAMTSLQTGATLQKITVVSALSSPSPTILVLILSFCTFIYDFPCSRVSNALQKSRHIRSAPIPLSRKGFHVQRRGEEVQSVVVKSMFYFIPFPFTSMTLVILLFRIISKALQTMSVRLVSH